MRILYFTRDYTPHDHRFLSALSESEHKVFCLRLEKRDPQREDRMFPARVEQVSWRGGSKPANWRDGFALLNDLRRVIRSIKPDLIHAGPVQSAGLLAALSGFHPLVVMSWGSDLLKDADRNILWNAATRYTLKHADVLVGDCQAVADKAVSLGFQPERMVLFPWGVDITHFSPGKPGTLRQILGWQDCLVILSTRSWEPIYGVDVFVRGVALAAQTDQRLRLLMLGNGSQADLLREIVKQAGLSDRVHFAGQVPYDKLPDVYRSADVYVSASHSDGSSVSLMEALASGLPALVSDIPGNREWIKPGEAGWLFPDGDEAALAKTLLQVVNQRPTLEKIGHTARALAEQRADWSKNFPELLRAYNIAVHSTPEMSPLP